MFTQGHSIAHFSIEFSPPGPVGSVSQPNRILRGNLEDSKNLFSPVGFICLGISSASV